MVKEMKGVEKYIYIIIGFIFVFVLASILVYGMNKSKLLEKEVENEFTDREDGVKFLEVRSIKGKLAEEFEIVLNGKVHKMYVSFGYYGADKYVDEHVSGFYNNLLFYHEEKKGVEFEYDDEYFLSRFNENNFQIIKGKDGKNYLAVWASLFSETNGDDKLYIFNDDLTLLDDDSLRFYSCVRETDMSFVVHSKWQYTILEDEGVWYKDERGLCKDDKNKKCHINVKIEDNKIHYLVPIIKQIGENDFGYVEERVYEINNSRLEYEVISTRKIVNLANSLC